MGMPIGQRVMLIYWNAAPGDDLYLPIGATGEIWSHLDEDGEYDVMFPDHPCPVSLPDTSWIVPAQWLIPLDDVEELKHATHDELAVL